MFMYFLMPSLLVTIFFILSKFIDLETPAYVSAFNEVRFKAFKPAYNVIYFLLTGILTYLLTSALTTNTNLYYVKHFNYEFVLYPNVAFVWMIPSLFLSMLLSSFLLAFIARLHFKEDYKSFMSFLNNYHGFNLDKLVKPIFYMTLFISSIFMYYCFNTYFYIKENKIIYRNLFDSGTTSMNVSEIAKVENCEFLHKGVLNTYTYLHFINGEKVFLGNFLYDQSPTENEVFVQKLSKRLGQEIVKTKCSKDQ